MALLERYDTILSASDTDPLPSHDVATRLQRLLDRGDLRIQQLKVSRSAASKALHMPVDRLTRNARLMEILEAHDERLATSLLEKISARLARDYATGTLTLNHGKVSRECICASFRLAMSTLRAQPRLHALLERYDRLVAVDYTPGPPAADPHERKLAKWLEEALRNGTLRSAAGKVSRTAAAHVLDISMRRLCASSRLMSIISRYDKAVQSGYVTSIQRDRIERLETLLGSKSCPIHPLGISIDQLKVGRSIGISPQALMRAPYLSLVLEKNAALLDEAKSDAIDTFYCGRRFVLSPYVKHLPADFIESVARTFRITYEGSSKSLREKSFAQLKMLFEFVCKSKDVAASTVRSQICEGVSISPDAWLKGLALRRKQISVRKASSKEISTTISVLNGLVSRLGEAGIVPRVEMPRRYRRRDGRAGGRSKTLAEAPPSVRTETDLDPYLAFAKSTLPEAAIRLRVPIEGESRVFLDALGRELNKAGDTLDPRPEVAIQNILRMRLEAIRQSASAVLVRWMEHAAKRESLRAMETLDTSTFLRRFLEKRDTRFSQLRENFPDPAMGDNTQVGLANLLALIEREFNGVAPSDRSLDVPKELRRFFSSRYAEWGGIGVVEAYLHPHREAYSALAVLYMCESGANVSVARTLPVTCSETVDDDRMVRVTGIKERANGKAIYADLRRDSLLVRAMDWIRSDVLALPAERRSDDLLTMHIGTRYQCLSESQLRTWFASMTQSMPSLRDLRLTPRMIRPSVILLHALENDGKHRLGMAFGQHSEKVAEGYQNRWPTRLIYDHNIRRFQDSLETLVATNMHDAAKRLGISDAEFVKRIDTVQATGFGTFCAKAIREPQPLSAGCHKLNCWDDCPNMVFVAQIEAVVTIQLWQTALKRAAPSWERDRAERWNDVWLPWLCVFNVIEEKMVRGPHLKIWNAAASRRATYEARPQFVAPAPW